MLFDLGFSVIIFSRFTFSLFFRCSFVVVVVDAVDCCCCLLLCVVSIVIYASDILTSAYFLFSFFEVGC